MADVKISGLPASTTPLAGTEVLPIVQSSTTKKVSVADLTAGRNISALGAAFSGASGRITGDFSNATIANRLMFQNSTANATSFVGVLPSGTGTGARFVAYNNSDPTNASRISLNADASTVSIVSAIDGTGTYLPIIFTTNGAERLRLFNSGGLSLGNTTDPGGTSLSVSGSCFVGTTSAVVGGKLSVSVDGTPGGFACTSAAGGTVLDLNRSNSTSGDVVYIRTSGATLAGYITCPTATTTSYLSISDYRLKSNIQPMTGALDRVMQLKPCVYTWKADNSKSEGFIAHELQSVVPEAVGGIKDALNEDGSPKYQGVDAGSASLIAVLTAAIKELNDKFDAYVASHP